MFRGNNISDINSLKNLSKLSSLKNFELELR